MSGKPALAVTVDMDEWYHCRWATGSPRSRWRTTEAFFRDRYGADCPAGEIREPMARVLALFTRHGVRATFFILGEMAQAYPDLVRDVVAAGHEVACHGMHHVDLGERQAFTDDLRRAKGILEDVSGQAVTGFRAPNLILRPWVLDILHDLGFAYDSSVCPSRALFGKYEGLSEAPQTPYRPAAGDPARRGGHPVVEIPIPAFPVLKLPAATGIMTRVAGSWWCRIGLGRALRKGAACYYFHPYEIAPAPKFPGKPLKVRLFLRRTGPWLERTLDRLLRDLNVRLLTAGELAAETAEKYPCA
ncbi:polysaccharide deacetylase [Solidesulfovibrio fructosivorans JJ]]|uniref:Polysaccharide deacetylase n=1 Tax=Solidesulfovibrio fructosivorans JJ] TaxID=596151 RepID=E1JXW4_SOLFR|nr:polysaccharide deacetylase family protein [Solidesulfovibrio fructosivorans]EFL50887.1 polysaccharide deacetylase [Solidesulfovibrio fructosivorans JJ]]